jgi:glycosyltransferase involved in cell wall biosynthesis
VRSKHTNDFDILPVPNDASRNAWARVWLSVGKVRGFRRLRRGLHWVGQPGRHLEIQRGREDFSFPGTWRLLELPPERPDVIHCHNLHGGYFDLRALPWLSQQVPLVLTLHDTWLLSGHCGYSLDCERWKTGCGHCPDLTIYPAVRRDATAYNWRRKREIYAKSRLYVATPCRWLMQRVEQSMLGPAMVEGRVIPYGVNLSVFRAEEGLTARAALDIPQNVRVLLFAAHRGRRNPFKDYDTIQAAVAQVAERQPRQSILFIALGEDAPAEQIGGAEVRFVPYQKDPAVVALYYQAADLYLHAARADTFPNTVLEALACGTPVVATAVGGIPEQIKGLQSSERSILDLNRYGVDEATGVLVPPGDPQAMATVIEQLLNNESLRRHIGENASKDAQRRFDLRRHASDYLEWYKQLREETALSAGATVDSPSTGQVQE